MDKNTIIGFVLIAAVRLQNLNPNNCKNFNAETTPLLRLNRKNWKRYNKAKW